MSETDIHKSSKKAARIQTVVCGFLFSIFSFVYMYVFQRDILEALHYSLAHGKTHYAPLATALVLTVILVLLRWGTNSLLGLKGEVRAWSYFPSCLILGVLTAVGRTIYMESYHTVWGWLLPVILLVYFVVTFWLRHVFRAWLNEECSPITIMNTNLLVLFVLCLMTVWIGNSNRTFHHELQAERYLRERQYDKALEVGRKSLESSRSLTVLRSYAMSRAGVLGDKLFEYPQYYRSEGLFFADDSLTVLRYTNDSIYYMLGVRPYKGEGRMEFLRNICYKGTGKYLALDYYLSALLLEKELDGFAESLEELVDTATVLPRHYKEAVLMYKSKHPDYPFNVSDTTLMGRYEDYKALQQTFKLPMEEKNLMRREYGDTYWWYFDYQE